MKSDELRDSFLGWQCRIRQIAVRQNQGRPSEGITASVFDGSRQGADDITPLYNIITVLNKSPGYPLTEEFRHIYRKTYDPEKRLESILEFLGERYYQRHHEFSDQLTATFSHGSAIAHELVGQRHLMSYQQFTQRFDLVCDVRLLEHTDPLYQSTFWHNLLFNPNLPGNVLVLAFHPDWSKSSGTCT